MAIKPIPSETVPVVDAQGRITPPWYEYFRSREKVGLSMLPDVKLTALANGQVLIWNAADGKYENGSN
jgi:hypothetical protein